MKHITIITGLQNTDTLNLAKQIAKEKKIENIVIIEDPNFENPFLYENCDQNTGMIIFNNPKHIVESEIKFLAICDGLIVNKKAEKRFSIKPKLVITTSAGIGFLKMIFEDAQKIQILQIKEDIKKPFMNEKLIKETIDASNILINELQEKIDTQKIIIEFSKGLCIHRHDDLSNAFEEVAHTHKTIYKCSICGETTTA